MSINSQKPETDLIKQAAVLACRAVPFIFPTDTVYGIGIAAFKDSSLEALYTVKERDRDKAIPWLVTGVQDLETYGVEVPDYALRLAEKHWPGALTLIVKASAAVPEEFRAQDASIALRAPDCPIALALIKELGVPIATSSANLQGQQPPVSFEEIDGGLLNRVELAIDGGVCQRKNASTIVSCLGELPQIVRQGAISEAELWKKSIKQNCGKSIKQNCEKEHQAERTEMKGLTVAVASDHGGFEQKKQLVTWMLKNGINIHDLGPYTGDAVDYPDFAALVADEVSRGLAERGVLVCGTGIGMAITANKFLGIRAANVTLPEFAELAREHNDANVICLSGRFVDLQTNKSILERFFATEFAGGRHSARVEKINLIDQRLKGDNR